MSSGTTSAGSGRDEPGTPSPARMSDAIPAVPRFGHGSRVPGWDREVDLDKAPAHIPDPETTPVPDELRQAVTEAMAKYPDRHSAVIPALHAAQQLHGWCSPQAIEQVAAVMQVTPAYLDSVATFYDMLETEAEPREHHDVYVCTNISCSLCGADELYEAMIAAAADHEDIHVCSFECLGACDIAPMASVDGEYVGPLTLDDADQVVADLAAGHEVLKDKQLRYRKCADPGVAEGAAEFPPPPAEAPKADAVGLSAEGDKRDRPGPSAPIEEEADLQ